MYNRLRIIQGTVNKLGIKTRLIKDANYMEYDYLVVINPDDYTTMNLALEGIPHTDDERGITIT